MKLGKFSHVFEPKITSGGEFRVPKLVAEKLEALSAQDLDQQITITLDVVEDHFNAGVKKSASGSSAKRQGRLKKANKIPPQATVTKSDVEEHFKAEVRQSALDSPAKRRKRLKKANKIPKATLTKAIVFERNPDVVAEVLYQANGVCGLCNKKAPFIRKYDGKPYLEVHHQFRIAEGGEDTVENAIALCPNCHRQEHYG